MATNNLLSSSIGRKILMSLTGLFLISFLVIHLSINLLTLIPNPDYFNQASHFMATNPLIQAMQFVLALGFLVHILMGIRLALKNKNARPVDYAFNKPSTNSNWSSRNMIITGILVLLFLILHMRHFFYEMKFGDMNGYPDDYTLVTELFSIWYYTLIYVVSFILLGIHLFHGFQSAFQSIGANHPKYTPAIKQVSILFCFLVTIGFSAIAIVHFII